MKYFLKVLFTPSCWLQNYLYSSNWDKLLNELMETHTFTNVTEYTANLGNVRVWIENYPYAAFTPDRSIKVRPSRRTILKAYDKLVNDVFVETK